MSGFNLRGMLTAVQTMVTALPTIQSTSAAVYLGVPESFAALINAFIVLGPATPNDSTMGGQDWSPVITVVFAYRVQAIESLAELIIADLILELVDAVNANPSLGGVVDGDRTSLNMSGAASPQYQAVAGSEVRMYPVAITGFQQRYLP